VACDETIDFASSPAALVLFSFVKLSEAAADKAREPSKRATWGSISTCDIFVSDRLSTCNNDVSDSERGEGVSGPVISKEED